MILNYNETRKSARDWLPRRTGRSLLALLLVILLTCQLAVQVFASDPASDPSAPAASEPGGTTPGQPVVRQTVTVQETDEVPVTAGTAATNTYMLEVSTGTVLGGGAADNVKYFIIYYTTETVGADDSVVTHRRSQVIFPGKDGVSKSLEMAQAIGNRSKRIQDVSNCFGYSLPSLTDRKGLSSVEYDQYLFTSPDPIKTIDRIQIFGKEEGSKSTWAMQSMHISRVDQIYGLDMYGWYSDKAFIDYRGEIIADVVMAKGGGIFYWNSSGGVYTIAPPNELTQIGLELVNAANKDSFGKPHHVGERHSSQTQNRVVFRMDLADTADSGFECLTGSFQAGTESTVSALQFCEAAALRIRYEDIYGSIREFSVPMIVNSLGWTMEKLGKDPAIAGFGQQGDSIPMSLMLPDFSSIEEVELLMGESKARSQCRLSVTAGPDKTIRADRLQKVEKEMISYVCFAAYDDVAVTIDHDSASLRYSYTPGAQQPSKYITAGGIEGVKVDAGTRTKLPLLPYHPNVKLQPGDSRDRYLITICTDNVVNAGTEKDIYLKFRYLDMKDKEVTTGEYKLRDLVRQYYGDWPGNVSDFAYRYGFRAGGVIKLIIPLNNVKQFRTVSVRVDGQDEWQFKGIEIHAIKSVSAQPVSPRIFEWVEIHEPWTEGRTLESHLLVSRTTDIQADPCFSCGIIYEDPDEAPDPTDEHSGWTPGNLVQDDGKYHEFDGKSSEVSAEEDINWNDYRLYMTYEDTLKNLGFNKVRCTYQVTVKVAGSKTNSDDDDCGSANLFYFQLLFENGNSGCVLANQQLQSDSFRTGAEAQFLISTTQDYGDLDSIRVIPDDQDSNGNIYDKLQIEYIEVKKQSTGKISPTWRADSESEDGLGWVGISYQDPGSAGSNQGTKGRSISEIAHTFEITKTKYSTKLLISITTGEYASTVLPDASGNLVPVVDPPLEGGMSMSYFYYDHKGNVRPVEPFDVIHLMNEYSGLKDNHDRTIKGVKETMDFCVSNTNYQFRPGKTDKFYVDVDDISRIVSMQLQIRSSVVTHWNINNVSVYLVQGPGSRYINGNGEYDYKYPEGEGLSLRCTWNQLEPLSKDVEIFQILNQADPSLPQQEVSIATVNINFNENTFPVGDEWTSTVTAEPNSKDDVVNLFLYPSTESAATNPADYDLNAKIRYTDVRSQAEVAIETGNMEYTTDAAGRPVYYALGLNTNYIDSLQGIDVKTRSIRPVHVPISYGIVQRIRGGVLIDSFYLLGAGNADLGITMNPATVPSIQNVQRLFLQVSQNTLVQELIPDEKDLAVALYFRPDDPAGKELRTKYIFLTDMGYKSIRPGQLLELDYSLLNVKEIVGVNLVTMGRLDASFEDGEILEQNVDGTVRNKWSLQGGMTPSRTPARFDVNGLVTLLDLDIKTAVSEGTVNTGTSGPVRMTVNYLDSTNNPATKVYPNIRPYLTTSDGFKAGGADHIQLLIADMKELRWVELEPQSETPAASEDEFIPAAWKLESLAAMTDLSGVYITRMLNELILEQQPLRVSFAEILMAGTVSIIHEAEEIGNASGDYVIPTGGSLDLALNAGEGIRLVPKIQGSKEGINVVLNRLDPTTGGLGFADLVDTRGYTAALLEQYAQNAENLGNLNEAAVWRSITPDDGTWTVSETHDPITDRHDTEYVVLVPPHNYTGSPISYRITLSSRENSAASVCVNLTVPSEPNPVDDLLSEARMRDQAASGDHQHTIIHTTAVNPTCTESGHSEYYSCSGCGRYFSDALGENVIDLSSTYLDALGHSFGAWTPVEGMNMHNRTCSRCGSLEEGFCSFSEWHENGDETHSRSCTVCGRTQTEACSFGQWYYDNNDTHSRNCYTCGYHEVKPHVRPSNVENYVDIDSDGHPIYMCSDCHDTWIDYSTVIPTTPTEPDPTEPPDTTEPSDSTEPTDPTSDPEPTTAADPRQSRALDAAPLDEAPVFGGITRRKAGAPHV